jgi:hypothetical protein
MSGILEHCICELHPQLFTYDIVKQFCNHVKCADAALPCFIEEVQNDLTGVHEWSRALLGISGVISPRTLSLEDNVSGTFSERDTVLTFMSLKVEHLI